MTKTKQRIAIGLSILFVVLYGVESLASKTIEHVYTQHIYKFITYIKGAVYGVFPFSIGDLFYIGIILCVFVYLYKLSKSIWKRNWHSFRQVLLSLYMLMIGLWIYFNLSWGLNYYRVPVRQYFKIPEQEIVVSDYKALVKKYILITNALQVKASSIAFDRSKADHEISSYIQSDKRWNDYFIKANLQVKNPLSSEFISYMLVGGYFNPFTHEAHVNSNLPLTSYPFTLAHELIHKMGVGFEDECNFMAFLYLRDVENSWYRYSAYLAITQYLLRDLYYIDSSAFESIKEGLSEEVRLDLKKEQQHWAKYTSISSSISSVLYNIYLQSNNQPEGLKRYSQVSRLVYDWEMGYKF